MSTALPPSPNQFSSVEEWARQFYEFYLSQTRVRDENDPLPIQLPHRVNEIMERAATDGIMLFDPAYGSPVTSEDGAWEPTRTQPQFSIEYDTAFNVNGATVTTGGDKVPFDTQEIDRSKWATFNPTTNDFDLIQGRYQIEGFVTLTKLSGGAKNLTGYLAESSDLTTPVGTVKMGTVRFAAAAPNNTTLVVPFRGQVTVPSGGGTYAMVVQTPDSNVAFGVAHSISGYDNAYARLSISLVGLNE